MRDIDLRPVADGGNFVSGVTGFRIQGGEEGDLFGSSVSNVGDVNGDGIDDFAVGGVCAVPNGISNAGIVYIIFGRAEGISWSDIDMRISEGNFISGVTGFRVQGTAIGENLGISVSYLGDVNGDGIDDFIIGAPGANPNGLVGAGRAYVIFGKGSNDPWIDVDLRESGGNFVSGTTGFRVHGGSASSDFGRLVSGIGDINGDGIDDFIIGARRELGAGGRAYVMFGRDADTTWVDIDLRESGGNFVSGTTGFRIHGPLSGFFGSTVSGLGDINGDGIDDFIIGSGDIDRGVNGLDAGAAYIIFGRGSNSAWADIDVSSSSDFTPGTTGFQVEGDTADDEDDTSPQGMLGCSASDLGDVNGDGVRDFIIGACDLGNGSVNSTGGAYVLFGRDGGNPWEDIDVSYSHLSGFEGGNFVVGTTGFRIFGAIQDDMLGFWVSNLGDINGDGIDDFAIGGPGIRSRFLPDAGAVYVIFGRDSNTPWTSIHLGDEDFVSGVTGFRVLGAAANGELGSSISSIGDINGDGIDDFIIGAPDINLNGLTAAGEAYVIFGTCLSDDYEILGGGTFSRKICAEGANIVASDDLSDDLTINNSLISRSGKVDLSSATGGITLDGASLKASGFTGDGVAIDLSGASSLDFINDPILDAGSGFVLLPAQDVVSGSAIITGITCYNSAFEIMGDIASTLCYDGAITTALGSTALTIISDIYSLSGEVDLSGATGALTLNGASITAAISIDLSGASSLTFIGANTLMQATVGLSFCLPVSGYQALPLP